MRRFLTVRSRVLKVVVSAAVVSAGLAGGAGQRGDAAPRRVVVIDPGHNGRNAAHAKDINRLVDIGTKKKACNTVGTSTKSGLVEAAYNFDLGLRVKRALERRGIEVILTRTDNTGWGPCIDERAAVANRAGAAAIVSIHADGGPPNGRGFFLITPRLVRGLTDDTTAPSRQLAERVRASVVASGVMPTSSYFGSAGLATSDQYGTLNLAKVPTAILETGNMRNATDAALLETEAWRTRMADAIADGIAAFVDQS
jgi:N-acetylmuramoyl-L-alanine amidase